MIIISDGNVDTNVSLPDGLTAEESIQLDQATMMRKNRENIKVEFHLTNNKVESRTNNNEAACP